MNLQGYTVFSGATKHGAKGNQAVRNAEQAGQTVQYYKKVQHTNKNTLDGRHVAKILNAQEDVKPKSMPHDLKLAIIQARQAKGWNRQQFAKMIQIPKQDVNYWQTGKTVPPGAVIAKMEKILGCKLPRPPKN